MNLNSLQVVTKECREAAAPSQLRAHHRVCRDEYQRRGLPCGTIERTVRYKAETRDGVANYYTIPSEGKSKSSKSMLLAAVNGAWYPRPVDGKGGLGEISCPVIEKIGQGSRALQE